ncbi:MAG: transketolase [Lachnotalea sp.]
MKSRAELEYIARNIRKDVFEMALNSGTKGAHIGGSMSATDILAVLYGDFLKYDAHNSEWDERDRFIMSKAHSAIGLYGALHYAGYLSDEDIKGAMQNESFLYKHPKLDVAHGLEFSGGSLGQGLALGIGSLLSMQLRGNTTSKVYVMMGDGECDEGSVWEGASSAVHFGLNNLTAIIDVNGLQNDGVTSKIMNIGNMADRWRSVGFETIEVDGHDVEDIQKAFLVHTDRPKAIIAKTIKGKGVSFAENRVEWHIGYFTQEMYNKAKEELK